MGDPSRRSYLNTTQQSATKNGIFNPKSGITTTQMWMSIATEMAVRRRSTNIPSIIAITPETSFPSTRNGVNLNTQLSKLMEQSSMLLEVDWRRKISSEPWPSESLIDSPTSLNSPIPNHSTHSKNLYEDITISTTRPELSKSHLIWLGIIMKDRQEFGSMKISARTIHRRKNIFCNRRSGTKISLKTRNITCQWVSTKQKWWEIYSKLLRIRLKKEFILIRISGIKSTEIGWDLKRPNIW